ncbi:hypothetical protein AB1N83_012247 [Pleurotus pulmonarius]
MIEQGRHRALGHPSLRRAPPLKPCASLPEADNKDKSWKWARSDPPIHPKPGSPKSLKPMLPSFCAEASLCSCNAMRNRLSVFLIIISIT